LADTIREQIVQAFVTRAGEITGYSVVRSRNPVSESDLPCINVIPGRDQAEARYGKVVSVFPITIEAIQTTDLDAASAAQEDMLGDLLTAFTDPSDPVSALAEHIRYTDGGPTGINQAKDAVVGVSIIVEVKYSTILGNPYKQ
jgi:hypothetical protein